MYYNYVYNIIKTIYTDTCKPSFRTCLCLLSMALDVGPIDVASLSSSYLYCFHVLGSVGISISVNWGDPINNKTENVEAAEEFRQFYVSFILFFKISLKIVF